MAGGGLDRIDRMLTHGGSETGFRIFTWGRFRRARRLVSC